MRQKNCKKSLMVGDTNGGPQRKTQVKGVFEMTSSSSRGLSFLCALFFVVVLIIVSFAFPCRSFAQTELAGVSGRITDASGAVIVDAEVEIKNVETGISTAVKTNQDGLYTIPSLHPGHYLINVRKTGFRSVTVTEVTLNVQDNVVRNFALQVGSITETVTITSDQLNINTTDATVSTVVDRQFAENLPLNGRSFQTLIQLTPGVVATASSNAEGGQFSVNGQRTASNYWTVDGVSANVGVSTTNQTANGISGAQASSSVLGGTNSLVSVDALQEFRIQTSTYAPEFGRTPGGQISIVTRSGTNQWHGSLYDYFRNDVLDANNWFANSAGLPKPRERQNDFGGIFGGPIIRDRTFFFFSYEGLRLEVPQVAVVTVPDLSARQQAVPAIQPYLNAWPLPNGPDLGNGVAQFSASYSNRAALDAYSLRVDHRFNDQLSLFARYSYSPSSLIQRGSFSGGSLSVVTPSKIKPQTATVGSTWAVSQTVVNDVRFNYSRFSAGSYSYADDFGGAVPLPSLPVPSPFGSQNSEFAFLVIGVDNLGPVLGVQGRNIQRQFNLVDSVAVQKGTHALKFGADFRRLSPLYGNPEYFQEILFLGVAKAEAAQPLASFVASTRQAALLFRNLGAFAQDTWRVTPRLTLTYGLRWDLDVAPSSTPGLAAVTGFNQNDLSGLALAPGGTPAFKTTYGHFAPRLGLAYQARRNQNWQTVFRGGFGMFNDLASSELGNLIYFYYYPFGALKTVPGGTFPLSQSDAAPPAITTAGISSGAGFFGFDPNLTLPYVLEWNAAFEQGLGANQTISASYIGSVGRRQIRTISVNNPNQNFAQATLATNAGSSNYNALQIQFQRRLSRGLQGLASYTWSHSIDDASAGDAFDSALLSGAVSSNRASSDFDIRHSFSAGVTYDLQIPRMNPIGNALLRGWSLQSFVIARTALPVTITDGFAPIRNNSIQPRADLVLGQPLYLHGSEYPGGKAFNPGAFASPPVDPTTGNLLRQGTVPRNFLRAFGAAQWDLAVHRDFPIREDLKLQFRAEMFNVLNHPNFAPPVSDITNVAQFGRSIQTLGDYLAGASGGGQGLSSIYQIGGPRSMQFALKLSF
ncbi:MAG TPA: TonB-dependent receptor [Candidatus Acidoferrum sp.]|nr:TonB-dependent receptor [Candidatus Acidoferrum sp.]